MRIKERARRFSAAVEGIDSGTSADAPDLERELRTARLIAAADHSGESAVYGSLRERLIRIEDGQVPSAETCAARRRTAWFQFPVCTAAAVVLAVVGFYIMPRLPHGHDAPVASAAGSGARKSLLRQMESCFASAMPASGTTAQPNPAIYVDLFYLTAFHSMQRYPTFEEAQRNCREFHLLVPTPMPEDLLLAGVTLTPGDRGCVAMFRGAAGNSLILLENTIAARRYQPLRNLSGLVLTPPAVPEPSEKVPLGVGTAAWMQSEGYGQLAWQSGPVYCQLSGIGLDQETALRIAGSMR